MKKLLIFLLLLLMLAPSVNAAITQPEYQSSDWARKDVEKAINLGIAYYPLNGDFREPIQRGYFAENATFLVSLKFKTNLNHYIDLLSYRLQKVTGTDDRKYPIDVATQLGLLKGRGDSCLDEHSFITRQEAAVILARTYRSYGGVVPSTAKPFSFTDQSDIANWAMGDVQLMNQLGIMTGDMNGRFNPLDSFTIGQCYATLVRLSEKTPLANPELPNPFALITSRSEIVDSIVNYGRQSIYQFQAKDYFILIWEGGGGTMAGSQHHIVIIDQDLSYREYLLAVISGSNCLYGEQTPEPEHISVSPDGTKLYYTATVSHDAYYNGFEDQGPPIQLKGVYTVTMDLKTGEQTYTRADIN